MDSLTFDYLTRICKLANYENAYLKTIAVAISCYDFHLADSN
jgi:hypothetical protein